MKKIILFYFVFFISSNLFSQKILVDGKNILNIAHLNQDGYDIDYVILGDTTTIKPVLFYCTGSLANPLLFRVKEDQYSTLPMNIKAYLKECHIVIVSKKAIPIVADINDLDANKVFINKKTKETPEEFQKTNYLDYYVNEYHIVINEVLDHKWVDKTRVMIAGHSQGAQIVAKIASSNKNITHAAYLSANPLGRYYEEFGERLSNAKDKAATIKDIISDWASINQYKTVSQVKGGYDSPKTWDSYSKNLVDDLLLTDIPLFVGFGTADSKSQFIYTIPIEFLRYNKHNLIFIPYEGLEHSFFELNENGEPNYDKWHFDEVFRDVIDWWLHGKKEFNSYLGKQK